MKDKWGFSGPELFNQPLTNSQAETIDPGNGNVTCPANHYQGTTATNGTCRNDSCPLLESNIFWQSSAYYVGVGALDA